MFGWYTALDMLSTVLSRLCLGDIQLYICFLLYYHGYVWVIYSFRYAFYCIITVMFGWYTALYMLSTVLSRLCLGDIQLYICFLLYYHGYVWVIYSFIYAFYCIITVMFGWYTALYMLSTVLSRLCLGDIQLYICFLLYYHGYVWVIYSFIYAFYCIITVMFGWYTALYMLSTVLSRLCLGDIQLYICFLLYYHGYVWVIYSFIYAFYCITTVMFGWYTALYMRSTVLPRLCLGDIQLYICFLLYYDGYVWVIYSFIYAFYCITTVMFGWYTALYMLSTVLSRLCLGDIQLYICFLLYYHGYVWVIYSFIYAFYCITTVMFGWYAALYMLSTVLPRLCLGDIQLYICFLLYYDGYVWVIYSFIYAFYCITTVMFGWYTALYMLSTVLSRLCLGDIQLYICFLLYYHGYVWVIYSFIYAFYCIITVMFGWYTALYMLSTVLSRLCLGDIQLYICFLLYYHGYVWVIYSFIYAFYCIITVMFGWYTAACGKCFTKVFEKVGQQPSIRTMLTTKGFTLNDNYFYFPLVFAFLQNWLHSFSQYFLIFLDISHYGYQLYSCQMTFITILVLHYFSLWL